MATHSDALTGVIDFFEGMSVNSVSQIEALYEPDAEFRDPFNTVTGHEAIRRIFIDMYEQLEQPTFVVTGAFEKLPDPGSVEASGTDVDGRHQAFVTWAFNFRFKRFRRGQDQQVQGSSHLVFSPDGKLVVHHDYWDAAHQMYEKLPVVGALMRWMKQRISTA
jgi:hypothetical protein